ncbi:hypothetical protein [Plantibacter sp. YIM 135249]|uniref:hypothetical protein n=1 Tax=Plantibacter sp. YIM 135249 TaxID=3423918 RepID=UPI003D34C0A8
MPEAHPQPKPHWAAVVVGGSVYASGYCWCDGTGIHRIGLPPAPTPVPTTNEGETDG